MTQKKPEYERLSARAARGEYELSPPLDYLLLKQMPKEGDLAMGLYPDRKMTRELAEGFSQIPQTQIVGRLGSLHSQNLIVRVKSLGQWGWQITETGQKLLKKPEVTEMIKKWEEANSGNGAKGS